MTERGKISNPVYNIFRDQPIPGVSPLLINTLLYGGVSSSHVNSAFYLTLLVEALYLGQTFLPQLSGLPQCLGQILEFLPS